MNSGLRKTHKIMWPVLGLLGAVLIVLSINSVKESIGIDRDASVATTQQNAHIIEDNAQWYVSMQELTDTNKLQIVVKKPLKSASTSVYTTNGAQERGTLLGSIDNKGLYTFTVGKSIKEVQLYDGIKKSVIRNIDVSWD